MRDTSLKPDGHWLQATHLAEDHLLASLGGDGLGEELTDLAGVQVVDETPNTGLAEASQALIEVDELADGLVGVIVRALGRSGCTQHVGQKSGMPGFLVRHELNQRTVLGREASVEERLLVEDGQTVVEEVQLDPFLVQTKSDGLEIEITLDHVARKTAIGTKAASRGVGSWLGVDELAVGVVVRGRGIRWERSNRRGQGRRSLLCAGGGRSASIWTMAGWAGDLATPDRRNREGGGCLSLDRRVGSKRGC